MEEQIEDLDEMLLLFNEGLSHVKYDTPIQGMRALYRARPPPKKRSFPHFPPPKLFHSLTLRMVSPTSPSYDD